MTFDELFQSYVDYGFTKPVTPITYGSGIESLPVAQPTYTAPIADTFDRGRDGRTNQVSFNPDAKPATFSDIAKAIGFAMNPAMGIANLAVENMTGKSIAQNVMDAIGAMRGGDGQGVNAGFTGTPAQMEALASEYGGTFGGGGFSDGTSSASDGGEAGAAAASAAGANDGPDTGGSFAKGGIVSLYG